MPVLATAGHVDHGKSTILRKITGMEPSRLSQERTRGMTMQLGFVWREVSANKTIGFVDVPGHTDYARSMISGVSGVDGFLFAIAANEGFMPQSEEHLFILEQLQIDQGLVVVTKSDLVTPKQLEELIDEVSLRFEISLNKPVEVVSFSEKNPEDVLRLQVAVDRLSDALPQIEAAKVPKMLVDRVFSPKGQGTVLTGTLTEGTLVVGGQVELTANHKKAQIRQLNSYGTSLEKVSSKARVAINLSDVAVSDIPKGTQLSSPGSVFYTAQVDCELNFREEGESRPKKPLMVEISQGGASVPALLIPISQKEDSRFFVRLKFDHSQWVRFGDRLLVKTSDGRITFAGGVVADESPKSSIKKSLAFLELFESYTLQEYLLFHLEKFGFIESKELLLRTRFTQDEIKKASEYSPDIYELGGYLVELNKQEQLEKRVITYLEDFHNSSPEVEGVPANKLAKDLFLDQNYLDTLIGRLKGKIAFGAGKITPKVTQSGPNLKLVSHSPKVQTSVLAGVLEKLAGSSEVTSQSLVDLGVHSKKDRAILRRFVDDGKLVRLGEKHLISSLAYQESCDKVRNHLSGSESSSTAELRDVLGIGRKLAILILEQMDTEKITVMSENMRRLS